MELGKGLKGQDAIARPRTLDQLGGPQMLLAASSIHGIDEDVGV